ncbi:hypothetical protein PRECH8_06840 [Insulibacter thermoxylanivorax]|uniref:YfhD-like protein n=1 Tax=Insulibacter thermoxylanivorax TaxID=2749268 RepID=A0A916VF20_9BACL|nr:YfhD family protein [Insulibacter thermoxylanivorax]GFR37388.1 hypothetical protein PRECH8_06840 [Insulibacter thermoxylanivorax]
MHKANQKHRRPMPIGRRHDVEYAEELADVEDQQAQATAEAAERRQMGRT